MSCCHRRDTRKTRFYLGNIKSHVFNASYCFMLSIAKIRIIPETTKEKSKNLRYKRYQRAKRLFAYSKTAFL